MAKISRKYGDRKDAKRIFNIKGMEQICIDLKPHRCDSDVYINQKMDLTALVKYIEQKKSEGSDITYFHAFVTAIGKTIYNRPKLNRFVANRHLYEHLDIVVSFVAKISFDDKSEEIMILVKIEPSDTLETISQKIKKQVDDIRNKKTVKEGANSAIDVIGKLPNIIRVPLVGILKWFDKHGWLPASLMKDNLYYSSIILSNLGSIKCGAIYHNLTNLGTCSTLATIGEIKNEEILDENNAKKIIKVCEFGINLDERIADGYYFAKTVALLQYIFNNPKLLEEKIDEKIETNEIR